MFLCLLRLFGILLRYFLTSWKLIYILHWKMIAAFVTILSVPVNHKCGDYVVYISVIYHFQNPLKFVNGQVSLWEYFLLILPSLWITRYLRPSLHLSYLNKWGIYWIKYMFITRQWIKSITTVCSVYRNGLQTLYYKLLILYILFIVIWMFIQIKITGYACNTLQ